ncbi:MAG: hypothetical protein ACRDRK_06475 [Pseudonocardia sp.]
MAIQAIEPVAAAMTMIIHAPALTSVPAARCAPWCAQPDTGPDLAGRAAA